MKLPCIGPFFHQWGAWELDKSLRVYVRQCQKCHVWAKRRVSVEFPEGVDASTAIRHALYLLAEYSNGHESVTIAAAQEEIELVKRTLAAAELWIRARHAYPAGDRMHCKECFADLEDTANTKCDTRAIVKRLQDARL